MIFQTCSFYTHFSPLVKCIQGLVNKIQGLLKQYWSNEQFGTHKRTILSDKFLEEFTQGDWSQRNSPLKCLRAQIMYCTDTYGKRQHPFKLQLFQIETEVIKLTNECSIEINQNKKRADCSAITQCLFLSHFEITELLIIFKNSIRIFSWQEHSVQLLFQHQNHLPKLSREPTSQNTIHNDFWELIMRICDWFNLIWLWGLVPRTVLVKNFEGPTRHRDLLPHLKLRTLQFESV